MEQTQKVPMWLRKPQHKKTVVASDKGWIVEETGELLTRVPNLKQKIADYFGNTDLLVEQPIIQQEPEPEVKEIVELTEQPIVVTEEVQEASTVPEQPVAEETLPKEEVKDPVVQEEVKDPVVQEEVKKEEAPINTQKRRGRPRSTNK